MRRRLIFLLVVVVAIGVEPALAQSSRRDQPDVGARSDGDRVDIDVSDDQPGGEGSDPDSDEPPCVWRLVISDDARSAVHDVTGDRRFSDTGRWFETDDPTRCGGGSFGVPEGGEIDVDGLRLFARNQIDPGPPAARLPNLRWNEADRVEQWLVQAPLWFWIDDTYWTDYAATATAGRASVTAEALPVDAVWDPGDIDPSTITCVGDDATRPATDEEYDRWAFGQTPREWDPVHGVFDPDSAPTACFHTYQQLSSDELGQAFTLSTQVRFEVDATLIVDGIVIDTVALTPITETTSRPLHVGRLVVASGN